MLKKKKNPESAATSTPKHSQPPTRNANPNAYSTRPEHIREPALLLLGLYLIIEMAQVIYAAAQWM